MYQSIFRWFPKNAFSRVMGWLASQAWPPFLLERVMRVYIAIYRIDMDDFIRPDDGFPTFNAFFTRPLKPGARPLDPDPSRIVSPVDGAVSESGSIVQGRLFQAKGIDYGLEALLGGDPAWQTYDGGSFLTLYLSPRDYHRIHAPVEGKVLRFRYIPGDLWTVGPVGVENVPGLFARNERIVTFIGTAFGEVALVAVGATIVGKIKLVYHPVSSNIRYASPLSEILSEPYPVARGGELGRFELGSTVICLFRPGEARLDAFEPHDTVRLGQGIGTITTK